MKKKEGFEIQHVEVDLPQFDTDDEALVVAYRYLEKGAREIGADFTDPDDDWFPVWLLLRSGSGLLVLGNAHKHVMADYIGQLAQHCEATAVGAINSSWMVSAKEIGADRLAELGGRNLEHEPGRQEVLLMTGYAASKCEQYVAHIHRSPKMRPSLGAFKLMASTEDGQIVGAMVDPIIERLREGKP